jgi:hypothetical protein
MDFDFAGNELQDIGAFVGALIALALILQTAVGNTVMFLAEAAKSAFNYPSGKGGLIATGIGMGLGLFLGLATAVVSDSDTDDIIALCLIGLFAGLFMGAGAVQNHKASGSVNTNASAAIEMADRADEAEAEYREAERRAEVRQAVNEAALFIGGQEIPKDFPRKNGIVSPVVQRMNFTPDRAWEEDVPAGMWGADEDENLDDIILNTNPADYEGECDCTPSGEAAEAGEPVPYDFGPQTANRTAL